MSRPSSDAAGQVPRLVLASASPRRRELLAWLDLPYEVVPSSYEERLPERHPQPGELAMHLAREKALSVACDEPHALVLGADTIVALEDRVYGKPADAEDAVRMLSELSGRTHQVFTGVALVLPRHGSTVCRPPEQSFFSRTDVVFRQLVEPEIRAYVATGEPMDKAGGYAIQGYGGLLIEGIRGDYPNVVGLPVTALALRLRALGVPILGAAG